MSLLKILYRKIAGKQALKNKKEDCLSVWPLNNVVTVKKKSK
jgi:hypothetical protein